MRPMNGKAQPVHAVADTAALACLTGGAVGGQGRQEGSMSRLRDWLNPRPLWQYVLVQLALSTAILVLWGELLVLLTHGRYGFLSPVFFAIWVVIMTPFYVWQGKRRRAA
jgi:hypothetical protein